MIQTAITGQRQTTIAFTATATVEDTDAPYNLTTPGVVAVFTAKRERDRTDIVLQKTYFADGGSDEGITVNVAINNELDITISAAETAPDGDHFESNEYLLWDVIVTEADGTVVPVAGGPMRIRLGVGS